MNKIAIAILMAISYYSWAGTNDAYTLADFDGSTPELGLFGEPINPEFYDQDFTGTFRKSQHYQGLVHPTGEGADGPILAWFENETEAENAVVVSAVDASNDLIQNYLVKIPARTSIEVDITDLLGSDDIYFLSMLPFEVYWNTSFLQAGKRVGGLAVAPPRPTVDQQVVLNKCNYWNSSGFCKVTNSNGPAKGGWAIGYFITSDQVLSDGTTLLHLNVYYPTKDTLHHESTNIPRCQSSVLIPPDYFQTFARYTTARLIDWTGVGAVLKRFTTTGNGFCAGAGDPDNYPCLVDTNGDGTLDTPATWTVERSN